MHNCLYSFLGHILSQEDENHKGKSLPSTTKSHVHLVMMHCLHGELGGLVLQHQIAYVLFDLSGSQSCL